MKKSTQIRRGRTCVFQLHVHLVFVTKYRREVFNEEILSDLKVIFNSVLKDFNAKLLEFNEKSEHVHLLVNYPQKISISSLVNSLKGVSSRLIRKKKYPTITNALYGNSLWSPSYFASSCGGAPLTIIREYIETQMLIH